VSASASPGMLMPPPKRRRGVRRLNRWPIYLLMGVLGTVAMTGVYVVYQRGQRQQQQTAAEAASHQTKGAGAYGAALFADNQPLPTPQRSRGTITQASVDRPVAATQAVQQAQAQPQSAAEDARARAWQAYYQQLAAEEQARADAATKALAASTDVTTDNAAPAGPGVVGVTAGASATPPGGLPVTGSDGGAQAEKRAFLAQDGDPMGAKEDLLAGQHGPKFDTIMQGTAIPGVMVGGMTSDMPGMIVGSIAENIYDTATGNHLLIPQGARVIGSYDNSVSAGQERIGVIWQRIIFPDTSSLQLGSMEGADQGGYAGFHDQVNTHFWAKFGNALLISIAGAGIQLSQPQATDGQNYSPTSIGSASLGQQFGQLGQEYARAGMAIPNTLEIRPGYRFVLMAAKDIHLAPYVDRRTVRAAPATFGGPVLQ